VFVLQSLFYYGIKKIKNYNIKNFCEIILCEKLISRPPPSMAGDGLLGGGKKNFV
jgi:hypothetical protein